MQHENITDDDSVEITESKHWQWIKGDLTGDVVTFKDTDDKWINFNEGGRIAIGLKDEFLVNLDADIAGALIPQNSIGVDPLGVSKQSNIAPLKSATQIKSPIRLLFDKQKKNNKIDLVLEFPVNVPPKGMYDLMSTSFESDEVKTELKNFILDQLSKDDITDCLNNSIESLIESKYKGE
jgi:hypothetical protein